MEKIRMWLNSSQDYKQGIALYLQHGRDPLLIRLFSSEGYSDFKKEKLQSALQQLAGGAIQAKPTPTPTPIKSIAAPVDIPLPEKRWRKQRDEVEESLHRRWLPVYSEMMNLCARVGDLARAGKQDEACRMALRILDLDEQCDTFYYNRDFYLDHGKLPDEKKPIEISQDYMLWPKMLSNHERYARNFRRDVEKDPANVRKAELLKKHEWAVNEYKRLLKMKHAV